MDQTQRDVQRDVQTIREICDKTKNTERVVFPPLTEHETAITGWIQETRAGCSTHPMPWQILLDDQGTLDLKVASTLYQAQVGALTLTEFKGSFLTHIDMWGENITKAFVIFKDHVTGDDVLYPLTVIVSHNLYGRCLIDEILYVPLMAPNRIDIYFNTDARLLYARNESLMVPSNVYGDMIQSTYEEPIFFGRNQSLCIFEGHLCQSVNVVDDDGCKSLKGALNDVQIIRDICNRTKSVERVIVFPPLNEHEKAIAAWIQETRVGHVTTPMPWQILLDDQGDTRTLDLKTAKTLFKTQLTHTLPEFEGSFLTRIDMWGEYITKAFVRFKDCVTGDDVLYPLSITMSNGRYLIDERLYVPFMTSNKMDLYLNDDARVFYTQNERVIVPSNVYKGMIQSTYEEPIYFGRDQSLCIFEGHVRYAKDVVLEDDGSLKGALN
tara:strand:- start:9165 stop:10478 length:1314 start_codon:yes stop_codon:yes gene_type:complete